MRPPAMPSYDAGSLAALAAQEASIRAVFAGRLYTQVEPPILQPASVYLDRAGEDIKGRTFVFVDPGGAELCLRPDLTIPTCRMWLAQEGRAAAARLSYSGPAFRYPRDLDRPAQFLQSGVECLGVEEREDADAEVIGLVFAAVRAAGLKKLTVKHGDLGLFSALIDALDVPDEWRGRLKRHFWRPGYFRDLLARLTDGAAPASEAARPALLLALGAMDEARARAVIDDVLNLAGIAPVGGRSLDEIAGRLLEQAREAQAARLPAATAAIISDFMGAAGPTTEALKDIRRITKTAGPALAAPLARLERRMERIAAQNIDLSRAHFAADFGRNWEYYTGFVFELWARDAEGEVSIAGGGRYDTLLASLGAGRDIPAAGGAIRTERLLAARAAETAS